MKAIWLISVWEGQVVVGKIKYKHIYKTKESGMVEWFKQIYSINKNDLDGMVGEKKVETL